MKTPTEDIIRFFHNQHYVIVSTIDKNGHPHTACKGIVSIDKEKIYLLDLYHGVTYGNIRNNPVIGITAVDEHTFEGYCIKGKVRLEELNSDKEHITRKWEDKIIQRITHRVLKNLKGEKGHALHPEAQLPKPKYLLIVDIQEVVDLTPQQLKE